MEGLFGTPHRPEEVMDLLPVENPRALFNADFLEAFDTNGGHCLLDAIAANGLDEWTPDAPLRLFYGARDADVVPAEALSAERKFQARGAKVEAINVGPFEHDPSMLAAAPLIFEWLGELERGVSFEEGLQPSSG